MIILNIEEENPDYRKGLIDTPAGEIITLERGWNNNIGYESCVPRGLYELVPFNSPKYGSTFILVAPTLNVYDFEDNPDRPKNGRFLCLFTHYGNYPHNFVGCVGAGTSEFLKNDLPAISGNGGTRAVTKAFNEWVSDLEDKRLRIQ